jgi:hypothetical protein
VHLYSADSRPAMAIVLVRLLTRCQSLNNKNKTYYSSPLFFFFTQSRNKFKSFFFPYFFFKFRIDGIWCSGAERGVSFFLSSLFVFPSTG